MKYGKVGKRGWSVGRTASALTFGGLCLLGLGVAQSAPPAQSFEDLVKRATPAPKPDALVAPFAEDCDRARREIDRARCRGTQAFLRGKLPQTLMHTVVDSTRVVGVSAFDASVRGLRVRLVGCLTCDQPAEGPDGNPYYVTLAVPGKQSESLREGVILGETKVSFSDPTGAKSYETLVKPNLRAEFVFRADGSPWRHRGQKGVAFVPEGMRIFNRCTGEVIFSQPPSKQPVNVVEGLAGCDTPAAVATGTGGEVSAPRNKEGTDSETPDKLGARELGEALKANQVAIAQCDAQWKTPGSVEVEFDLAGSGGTAQSVRAKGNLGGTPVASCIADAVRDTKFPKFHQARQVFSYQVRLDGK